MRTVQVFFEDCLALKCNLIKSDFQLIRKCFLFLSIFGEVVLFCKKGKLTTCIKC